MIRRRDERRRQTEGERLEEELYAESTRHYWEQIRRKLNAERYRFQMNMCELHERLAAEHEERALRLLEEDDSEARKETK